MNTISVVIPIYNSEKYLQQCIDSVLVQTYQNFELILVDDGSIDSSREICKKYELKDSRIRYIYKENEGVSSARNVGIRCAEGDYITFVDSDDIIKPEMFEILLKNNNDFAMCGYELYDDVSSTVCAQFTCLPLCGTMHDLIHKIKDYLSPPYLLGPCFKLFKKSIIIEHNVIFPPELSYGEDAVFVLEYLAYCKTMSISPYIGYSYRKHGNESLSGRFLTNKIDINYRINTLIDELLKKENVAERTKILAERILECFVSYEKELICSALSRKEKRKLFYAKFNYYKKQLGKPQRMAQWIVVWAGKYRILYPLVYLFKMRG